MDKENAIQKIKDQNNLYSDQIKTSAMTTKQMERENQSFINELNKKEQEITELRNKVRMIEKENKNVKRDNNGLLNDKDRMAREKMEALNEKNITKAGVNALTREIEYLRKQVEAEKANIIGLIRDRDMMKKNISKAEEDNLRNKEEVIR